MRMPCRTYQDKVNPVKQTFPISQISETITNLDIVENTKKKAIITKSNGIYKKWMVRFTKGSKFKTFPWKKKLCINGKQ